jgi:hypothetical protein
LEQAGLPPLLAARVVRDDRHSIADALLAAESDRVQTFVAIAHNVREALYRADRDGDGGRILAACAALDGYTSRLLPAHNAPKTEETGLQGGGRGTPVGCVTAPTR